MSVILLSFLTCMVAVFSLRRAIYGERAVHIVRAAPRPVLMEAQELLDSGDGLDDDDEFGSSASDDAGDFVRGFSESLMSLVCISVVEVGLTIYFLFTIPELPAVWFLALKSAVILYWLPRQLFDSAGSVLKAVSELPDQLLRWQRIGDFIGCLCYALLFLIVNGLIPYSA